MWYLGVLALACSLTCSAQIAPASAPAPPSTLSSSGTYYILELEGEFGKEIHAPGIKAALADAKDLGASHFVFLINSDGGHVIDAQAIAKELNERSSDLVYIAVIQKAFSASIWILCHCDHLFYRETGVVGAAVIFDRDSTGQATAVDAKFANARWGEIARVAESNGQCPDVYRAMMIQDAELFSWEEAGARRVGSTAPPATATSVRIIDTRESVLALTPSLAESIGFGQRLPNDDIDEIGKLLGLSSWRRVKSTKTDPMRRTGTALIEADKQVSERKEQRVAAERLIWTTSEKLASLRRSAEDADPDRLVLYYYENSGDLTAESRRSWRQQSDIAIRAWRAYQSELQRLRDSEKSYEKSIAALERAWERQHTKRLWVGEPRRWTESRVIEHGINKDVSWQEAQRAIDDIAARRKRYKIDQR
jgi:hypothetical protein